MTSPVQILAALVEVTTEPPRADTDAAEILERAQQMSAEREPLLQQLRAVLSTAPINDDCTPLLTILRERDARWMSRLVRAQHELQQRLRHTRTAYAR